MIGFLLFVGCLILFRVLRLAWPVAIVAALPAAIAGVYLVAVT
jgi:hypothetical protein